MEGTPPHAQPSEPQNVISNFTMTFYNREYGEFLDIVWTDNEPAYYFDQKLWGARPTAMPSRGTSP